jgi:hypothetical protein
MDICIVINTCKQYYTSTINNLVTQIEEYNTIFPKENILIISGQEDDTSIHELNGITIVHVPYSGIHLTSAIYINENIHNFPTINYWVLLPDTIEFGTLFFTILYKYYTMYLKDHTIYSMSFIHPTICPTMDMGIIHTKHIINMTEYLHKIKLCEINTASLLDRKRQLIFDENMILGIQAVSPHLATSVTYIEKEPYTVYCITESIDDIDISKTDTIQTVYFKKLDLYKFQRNFKGPSAKLVITI